MATTETSILAAGQVRVCHEAQPIPLPGNAATSGPSVKLIRDGDELLGVEILCTCGERIRLRFDTTTRAA